MYKPDSWRGIYSYFGWGGFTCHGFQSRLMMSLAVGLQCSCSVLTPCDLYCVCVPHAHIDSSRLNFTWYQSYLSPSCFTPEVKPYIRWTCMCSTTWYMTSYRASFDSCCIMFLEEEGHASIFLSSFKWQTMCQKNSDSTLYCTPIIFVLWTSEEYRFRGTFYWSDVCIV